MRNFLGASVAVWCLTLIPSRVDKTLPTIHPISATKKMVSHWVEKFGFGKNEVVVNTGYYPND